MKLKERYKRFRVWQFTPVHYSMDMERHRCCNCKYEFQGNYCPKCGQKADAGPITWKSIRLGIMNVWGIGNRALLFTVAQLLLRPGFMICDYLNGRRQVSYPPFSMLVLVGLFTYYLAQLFDLNLLISEEEGVFAFSSLSAEGSVVSLFLSWLSSHFDYASLFIFSMLSLPTYIAFHYSPRNTRHTIPQELFIQVFNATQFLCVSFLCSVALKFDLLPVSVGSDIVLFVLLPMTLFVSYRQLFGYGCWGTLWRVVMCMFLMMVCIGMFYSIGFVLNDLVVGGDVRTHLSLLVFLLFVFCFTSGFMTFVNIWSMKHRRSRSRR